MRKKRSIILLLAGAGLSLLVSVLLVYHLYSEYHLIKTSFRKDLVDAFYEALKKDVENRKKALIKNFYFGFADNVKKDSVTLITSKGEQKSFRDNPDQKVDEKYINIIQSVLYQKNPIKVNALNELFREELIKRNIKVQSAVSFIDNILDTTYLSNRNIKLLSPIFSDPIAIGAKREVSLQAYTEISPVFIISRMSKSYWFIVLGWLLFVTGLTFFIPYQMRRTKMQIVQDYAKQLINFSSQQKNKFMVDAVMVEQEGLVGYPKHETMLVAHEAETSNTLGKNNLAEEVEEKEEPHQNFKGLVLLSEDLIFDFDNYKLYSKGKIVVMTLKPAKLLGSLLNAPNYYLSRQGLRDKVWANVSVTDEAVRRCVSRLNGGLSVSPNVKVVNLLGEGYRLDFTNGGPRVYVPGESPIEAESDLLAQTSEESSADIPGNPSVDSGTSLEGEQVMKVV